MYRDARLVAARSLCANVRELTFDPGVAFTFVPGQWVNLRLEVPGAPEPVVRAYSIASTPRADGCIDVAVTKTGGAMSTHLHAMEPGAVLSMSHAQGFFTLDEPRRPLLFVATGTGVSPLRAMLLSMTYERPDVAVTLLFGNRTEADVLYRDDFERLARDWPAFTFAPTLSRGEPSWSGRRGYVQAHLAELVRALGGDCDAYVCGLQKMVGDVRRILREELALDRKRVHTERYD